MTEVCSSDGLFLSSITMNNAADKYKELFTYISVIDVLIDHGVITSLM